MAALSFRRKQSAKKLAVIGLDGVSFQLLRTFTDENIMPNIRDLMNRYPLIRTTAPLPEVSPVSWTSMMTGLNPGEHSVFGFTKLNPRNYHYIFPHFPSMPVKTIWEKLKKNKRAVIINLPHTYPARPLKGTLVSGFVAVELEKSVFPSNLVLGLKQMNYRFDPDFTLIPDQKKAFLVDLEETMDIHRQFADQQLDSDWDFYVFIITETDRINHFFYNSFEDTASPFRSAFVSFYRRVDEIVGQMTKRLEASGIPFVLVSDHGFVSLKKEVYLTQYLKEWGYFHEKKPKPGADLQDLEIMDPKSTVFCLDPSRIYIHRKNKYAAGRVSDEEYDKIRNQLKHKFQELEIDGQKVLRNVYFKEEIYKGKYMPEAPDMVLLSNDGFDLKAGTLKDSKYGQTVFEGMHSYHNAVCVDACGLDLEDGDPVDVVGRKIERALH